MLFSCSKVGMLAAVSWGNVIGSQHGDQIPEREEAVKPLLGVQHNMDLSYKRPLFFVALSNIVHLEFNFITVINLRKIFLQMYSLQKNELFYKRISLNVPKLMGLGSAVVDLKLPSF